MTKRKANEWLKQVTGRKIKLDCWREGVYVIPTGEWRNNSDRDPFHWSFWCIDEKGKKGWFYVRNGFDLYVNFKWVFVETFDDYLEMYYSEG